MAKKMSSQKAKGKKTVVVDESVAVDTPLNETMFGTDIGNGGWDVYTFAGGKLRVDRCPHGRIPVSGTTLDESIVNTVEVDYADWKGRHNSYEDAARYTTGEGMWNTTSRPIESHRNSETRYGDDLHIFGIVRGLAKLNAPTDQPLTVVVPLPPGLVQQYTKPVKQALLMGENSTKDGKWSIRLKGWKQWKTYTIGRVVIMPEGAPAFAAYGIDIGGNVVQADYMKVERGDYKLGGHVMVVDLGYGTGDMFSIYDGSLNPDEIRHATNVEAGIQTHMVSKILEKVRQDTGAAHLTEAHADGWLRAWAIGGYSEEASVVKVSGRSLTLQGLFNRVCREYAEWVNQEMVAKAWRQGADAILIVGGGWLFVETEIRARNPKRTILAPHLFPHLSGIPVFGLNSYGGLVYLAHYLRNNG
jgi:hypothetical protein